MEEQIMPTGAVTTPVPPSPVSAPQAANPVENLDLESILHYVNTQDNISDIHLSGGEKIAFRTNGDIVRQMEYGVLSNEAIELMIQQSMKHDMERFRKFLADKDADYAYISKDNIPYRVNAFIKLGHLSVVMRKINAKPKQLNDLMFQDIADSVKNNILVRKKGLYLVTGPTGSGKSTSLVAMIEHLNQNRNEHIITIEDPIEFVFEAKQSLISQREVGGDTWSFANSLKAAMREDPDIIFVGEIRDRDTAEAALNMAETGHLVFSTLHTSSAAATVNRYISFFPPEIQESVSDRLAESLAGVQSQMLVKNTQGGRVGIYEFMINNTSIRNNIKKREIPQINNIIETSTSQGMITLKGYAQRLLEMGLVTPESVEFIFVQS